MKKDEEIAHPGCVDMFGPDVVVEVTDDPMRAPRISLQWANEQIEKYGKDNSWVLVNVFGEFPPELLNETKENE